jgi:hypothetical protein
MGASEGADGGPGLKNPRREHDIIINRTRTGQNGLDPNRTIEAGSPDLRDDARKPKDA